MRFFEYGEKEIEHLKSRDKVLGAAIGQIGMVRRRVDGDLFGMLIHSIVGQQISTKAQATIWGRIVEALGEVTPRRIGGLDLPRLQSFGISFRKAEYCKCLADVVLAGTLDIAALQSMSDDEVVRELSALRGIGVWTAEMLLIFSMQRPDVLSYGDLAIHRGMRMLYHHRAVSKKQFEKYRRRYSPYASVASLYLWAIAGGAITGMKDYAPKLKKPAGKRPVPLPAE